MVRLKPSMRDFKRDDGEEIIVTDSKIVPQRRDDGRGGVPHT